MVVGIIGLIVLLNIFVVIPAGNVGIKVLFGKVNGEQLAEGLHIVNPLADIVKMSIRTEEYTMASSYNEGNRRGSDHISALTKEGLKVNLDITVLYRLNPNEAAKLYKTVGLNFQEKIIRPEIRSVIRSVVATYDAKDIYSQKRTEVVSAIKDELSKRLESRGIIIEQVLLRKVDLPSGLSQSIQQKLQAEQDAQRLDFVLQKEKKEAERKRIEAQGQRDAQKIINESLTNRYLQYLYIKELKDRAGTIYVPVGNNGLPIMKGI